MRGLASQPWLFLSCSLSLFLAPVQPLTLHMSTRSETFRGKSVLLTGASGGLGQAFATALAESGVSSLYVSARKQESIQSLQEKLQASFPDLQIHFLPCDLASPDSVQQLCQQIEDKPIDILINNGGVSSRSSFLDTTAQVDAQVMQINFLAGATLCHAVVPGMVNRQAPGKIIWISSVQGLLGIPSRSSYAASKFAVQGYCESIRAELAHHGIAVHTISPGYIRTNLSQSAIQGDGSAYGRTDPTTAAGADPSDVASEVLDRVARGEVDFTVASSYSATIAIYLRWFLPSVLRKLLVRRYEKSLQDDGGRKKED